MCEYRCLNLSCVWIIHSFIVIQSFIYLCFPITLFCKTFEQHIGSMVWILSWNLAKWFHYGLLLKGPARQCGEKESSFSHADVLLQWCQMPTRKLKQLDAWIKIFSFQQIFVVWTDTVSMKSLWLFV